MAVTYHRTSHYECEELEGELVVMERNSRALTTLNPAGRLIWDAISYPVTLANLEEAVRTAFPDLGRDSLNDHIQVVLDALVAAELAFKSDEKARPATSAV